MSDIFKKAMDALTRGFQYQVNTELRPAESKAILDEIAQLDADLSISREGLRTFDPKFENALMENVELRSLLARMSEVGDYVLENYECAKKWMCAMLFEEYTQDEVVTRWQELKKEMEG